jgi:hypothetical protein
MGDRVMTQKRKGGVVSCQNRTGGGRQKRVDGGIYIKKLHHMSTVMRERADPSLVTQGWVGNEPCTDCGHLGAHVNVARPNITAGWLERQSN